MNKESLRKSFEEWLLSEIDAHNKSNGGMSAHTPHILANARANQGAWLGYQAAAKAKEVEIDQLINALSTIEMVTDNFEDKVLAETVNDILADFPTTAGKERKAERVARVAEIEAAAVEEAISWARSQPDVYDGDDLLNHIHQWPSKRRAEALQEPKE